MGILFCHGCMSTDLLFEPRNISFPSLGEDYTDKKTIGA